LINTVSWVLLHDAARPRWTEIRSIDSVWGASGCVVIVTVVVVVVVAVVVAVLVSVVVDVSVEVTVAVLVTVDVTKRVSVDVTVEVTVDVDVDCSVFVSVVRGIFGWITAVKPAVRTAVMIIAAPAVLLFIFTYGVYLGKVDIKGTFWNVWILRFGGYPRYVSLFQF
jgi:hypothetical protein